jgi:MFS family permease
MDTSNELLDQGQQLQSTLNTDHQAMLRDALDTRLKNIASWFYWIVAFSIANSILVMLDIRLNFSLGLDITRVVDIVVLRRLEDNASFEGGEPVYSLAGWIINVFILAFFAFLGYMVAQYRAAWALWIGVVLYGLDGILFLMDKQGLSVAFHAFVIYRFIQGFTVLKKIRQLDAIPDTLAG